MLTERPEAVDAGMVQLIGTGISRRKITASVETMFLNEESHNEMLGARNPIEIGTAACAKKNIRCSLYSNELKFNFKNGCTSFYMRPEPLATWWQKGQRKKVKNV